MAETFARVRVLWQDRRCEELSWRSPTPRPSCALTDNGLCYEELAEVTTNLERQTQRLLPGGTAALAASELQRIVKEVAAAANVDVRSCRLLPPIELTGLQEVPIELTVAGSIRDPVELLSKIEQTSGLLRVKDRKVRVVAVGQPREVLTTPTVAGYLLPANGNNP